MFAARQRHVPAPAKHVICGFMGACGTLTAPSGLVAWAVGGGDMMLSGIGTGAQT